LVEGNDATHIHSFSLFFRSTISRPSVVSIIIVTVFCSKASGRLSGKIDQKNLG
jgi:hypothetical protein